MQPQSRKLSREAKVEPVDTGDRERNPDGTFKAKEAAPEGEQPVKADTVATDPLKTALDAPERFTPAAKEAWKGRAGARQG